VGVGGEMTQALYAHMNNKIKKQKQNQKKKPHRIQKKSELMTNLTLLTWNA
jgi:hypothetical protein